MGVATLSTTSNKGKSVEFCPVCGTHRLPIEVQTAEARSFLGKCPSCGFDLNLAEPQGPHVLAAVPARVTSFAYLMVVIQCVASLLLGWTYLNLGSPLYLGANQSIAFLAFLSILLAGTFCVWLRTGRAITWARNALLAFGFLTAPLGVCAVAAAISIAGPRRYCAICLNRIAWSEHYSTCPHCMASFHRYGKCRETRRQLIREAWRREPSGDEISGTCPLCFQNLHRASVGGPQSE
jgi:predicted RNA-binding Zn-ribbon protein involved in translation (DUF1610 family)